MAGFPIMQKNQKIAAALLEQHIFTCAAGILSSETKKKALRRQSI